MNGMPIQPPPLKAKRQPYQRSTRSEGINGYRWSALTFALAGGLLLCGAGQANAQSACSLDPATGRYEPSLAWKQTLGADRADSMCKSLQVTAAKQVQGIPTSQGTAPPERTTAAQAPQHQAMDAPQTKPVAPAQIQAPVSDAIAKHVTAPADAHRIALTAVAIAPVKPVVTAQAAPAVSTIAASTKGPAAASKGGTFSLKYEGEGKELLGRQAASRGLEFHVLGPEPHTPLFVRVDQKNATFEDLLANVDAQFGERANVVLTNTAVEVHYRAAAKPVRTETDTAQVKPERQQDPVGAAVPIAETLSKGESLVGPKQVIPRQPDVVVTQDLKQEPLPTPLAPAKLPQEIWTMTAGHSVGRELTVWGKKAGWKVIWSLSTDWTVPAAASFSGDFKTAASDVIETLVTNGALIRAKFWDGNKTMVVTGPGVPEQ